jgi:carbonic anhydrase/acetyltransferase-like protein (isoleucine patch superfamily)
MKTNVFIGVMATVAIGIGSWAMMDATAQVPQSNAIAQMIRVEGKVELKRGKADYRIAEQGESLFRGDLLKVQRGSRGVVRCTSDSSTWTVPDDGLPWGVTNTCS